MGGSVVSRRAWDTVDFCLTPLGQQMFSDSKKMVYHCAGKSFRYYQNHGVLLTFDEVLSACSDGMVRAIHEWEHGRGKFSTCAYIWMCSYAQREAESWYDAHKHHKYMSEIKSDTDLFSKLVGTYHKPFAESDASRDLQTLMDKVELTDKQKNRLHMLFSGMTLMEISRSENVSFQAIQLSNSRSLQKLKECSK